MEKGRWALGLTDKLLNVFKLASDWLKFNEKTTRRNTMRDMKMEALTHSPASFVCHPPTKHNIVIKAYLLIYFHFDHPHSFAS